MDTERVLELIEKIHVKGLADPELEELRELLRGAVVDQANRAAAVEDARDLLHTADLLRACAELDQLLRTEGRLYPGTVEHAVAPILLDRLRAELSSTSAAFEAIAAPQEG